MNRLSLAIFSLTLVSSSLARADTIVFDNPTGDLGLSQVYNVAGTMITASAQGANAGDLFGKNIGSTEEGLGLTGDPSGDHELIPPPSFIQLDLTNLINAGITTVSFDFNSVQSGEGWHVFDCGTSGVLCNSSVGTGTSNLGTTVSGLGAATPFLDFTATSGNILVHSLTAIAIPEPGSSNLVVAGLGIIGAIAIVIRRRRSGSVRA
jgi:hypothetical protein